MILDGHIHMAPVPGGDYDANRSLLLSRMAQAGVSGGTLLSLDPSQAGERYTGKERIDQVLALRGAEPNLFAFHWIYPPDEDALDQVDYAVSKGIDGFKIICEDFYPRDERCMAVCRRAAAAGKPVLFHSGICWDGKDSARYNRPGEFECLLDVPNLRFTLAHVSWPWCDECIAVYGKFSNAYSLHPNLSCEMFVDLTPGTPPLWREDALKKLFCGDYEVMHNVIFGTDCDTVTYNVKWVTDWLRRDNDIYQRLGLSVNEKFLPHIYGENLLRFLGKKTENFERKIPVPGV